MGANCIPWAVSQHKPKAVMTFLTPKQHPPLSCSLSLSLPPSIAHTQSNGGIIVPQGFRRWHICHLEMCHCILKTRPSFLFGFSKIESSSWLSRSLAYSLSLSLLSELWGKFSSNYFLTSTGSVRRSPVPQRPSRVLVTFKVSTSVIASLSWKICCYMRCTLIEKIQISSKYLPFNVAEWNSNKIDWIICFYIKYLIEEMEMRNHIYI